MQSIVFPSFLAPSGPSLLGTQRSRRFASRLFARPATDRLFFAALPDASTADRIADLARRLKIGHGLTGQTRWGMLNAVTELVDHERGRSDNTRIESAWFGTGANLKNRALELLAA